jgi:hypothetical protein
MGGVLHGRGTPGGEIGFQPCSATVQLQRGSIHECTRMAGLGRVFGSGTCCAVAAVWWLVAAVQQYTCHVLHTAAERSRQVWCLRHPALDQQRALQGRLTQLGQWGQVGTCVRGSSATVVRLFLWSQHIHAARHCTQGWHT